jgi:hypothetical protein
MAEIEEKRLPFIAKSPFLGFYTEGVQKSKKDIKLKHFIKNTLKRVID